MNLILDIFILGLIVYLLFLFLAYVSKSKIFSQKLIKIVSLVIIVSTIVPILILII